MRGRAWALVKGRGSGHESGLLEYTDVGMTIQYTFFSNTHRLSVSTKAGKVLVAEWGNSGNAILMYKPGLWETRLKHLTRGAL